VDITANNPSGGPPWGWRRRGISISFMNHS
jgi:hypothetical protein